jgi:hypothetical protein
METSKNLSTLSEQELNLVCDAMNGISLVDGADVITQLVANVQDAISFHSLDKKWDVDTAGLIAKLTSLSEAETNAVLQYVANYWGKTAVNN